MGRKKNPDSAGERVRKRFRCEFCCKGWDRQSLLDKHVKKHHEGSSQLPFDFTADSDSDSGSDTSRDQIAATPAPQGGPVSMPARAIIDALKGKGKGKGAPARPTWKTVSTTSGSDDDAAAAVDGIIQTCLEKAKDMEEKKRKRQIDISAPTHINIEKNAPPRKKPALDQPQSRPADPAQGTAASTSRIHDHAQVPSAAMGAQGPLASLSSGTSHATPRSLPLSPTLSSQPHAKFPRVPQQLQNDFAGGLAGPSQSSEAMSHDPKPSSRSPAGNAVALSPSVLFGTIPFVQAKAGPSNAKAVFSKQLVQPNVAKPLSVATPPPSAGATGSSGPPSPITAASLSKHIKAVKAELAQVEAQAIQSEIEYREAEERMAVAGRKYKALEMQQLELKAQKKRLTRLRKQLKREAAA